MTLLDYIGLALGLMIFLLLGIEWRVWRADRQLSNRKSFAWRRLARRAFVGLLLILVLIVLRIPIYHDIPPRILFIKVVIALVLCAAVFIILIWDLRSITHQVRQESAQELQECLEAMALLQKVESDQNLAEGMEKNQSSNDTHV